MSRFRLIQEPGDNADLAHLYQEIIEAGFGGDAPINFFTSQGLRPDLLEAVWKLTKTIFVGGTLPAGLKQMAGMMISVRNHCKYCTVTHTGALESMGIAKNVIESCMSDPNLSEVPSQYREMLHFALKVAENPAGLTDEAFDKLRGNGLSDKEILELVMLAAFMNFINTWAEAVNIEIDGSPHGG